MLYWLLFPFASRYPVFNVFRYITFRTAMSAVTALFLALTLGPAMIRWPVMPLASSSTSP